MTNIDHSLTEAAGSGLKMINPSMPHSMILLPRLFFGDAILNFGFPQYDSVFHRFNSCS